MESQYSTEFWYSLADAHKRAADQALFKQAIDTYCKGLESVSIGCLGVECEHADGDEDHQCETHFSWGQCDSCGSTYGGDRFTAYGCWTDSGEFHTIEMAVCVDCAMYHANGELPETWSQDP
jgi:hypothetical protein